MFSGTLLKYINLDFISTHHILNSIAYKTVFRKRRNVYFPTLEKIQSYSGAAGPDGLWVSGKSSTSAHVFNPDNAQGDAIEEVSVNFDGLVCANRKGDFEQAAKSAAFLSHYIVDTLDPAHHVGYKKHSITHDDWHDPYLIAGSLAWLRNIGNRHLFFEVCSAYYLYFKQKIYTRRFLPVPRRKRSKHQLMRGLVRRARYLNQYRIYDSFFTKNSQNDAKKYILEMMFPMMIRSVSQFWYSAFRQSRRRA